MCEAPGLQASFSVILTWAWLHGTITWDTFTNNQDRSPLPKPMELNRNLEVVVGGECPRPRDFFPDDSKC